MVRFVTDFRPMNEEVVGLWSRVVQGALRLNSALLVAHRVVLQGLGGGRLATYFCDLAGVSWSSVDRAQRHVTAAPPAAEAALPVRRNRYYVITVVGEAVGPVGIYNRYQTYALAVKARSSVFGGRNIQFAAGSVSLAFATLADARDHFCRSTGFDSRAHERFV